MKIFFFILVFYVLILQKLTKSDELDSKSISLPETETSTTADEKITEKLTKPSELLTTTSTEKLSILEEAKQSEVLTTTETTERLKTPKEVKATEYFSTTTTEKLEIKRRKPTTTSQTTTQTSVETFSSVTDKNATVLTDSTVTPFIPESECSCDLKKGICDVNCCCDIDCSPSDRAVFSICYVQPNYTIHSKYCYTTQFIYKNNSQFKIQKEANSGLFCILSDNFPATSLYQNVQIMKDVDQVKKIQRLINRFSWPNPKFAPTEKFTYDGSYRHGSVLWAVNNGSNIFPWSLPKNTASFFCRNKKKLIYLEDWSSSCKHSIMNENDCVSNIFNTEEHYKNFKIIKSPSMINITDNEICNSTTCAQIKPLICKTDLLDCRNLTGRINNFYNRTENICYNVLHTFVTEVVHNGTFGIKEINAYIQVQNISVSLHNPTSFFQNYKISFKWFNQTNQTLERSGFPGYLFKKPLISGFKIQVNSTDEVNKTVIQFHSDHKRWISLIKSDGKLSCQRSERINILFGTNFQTSCQYIFPDDDLSATEACLNLNMKMMETLLGAKIVNSAVNLFISSLGDPGSDDLKDWIPIILQQQQRHECFDLITGMKLNILYAFIGPVLNPQAKIIGISVDFQTQSLSSASQHLFCHFKVCSVTLTSSVLFVDTTKSSFFKFAQIPVYEIKLPQDFFYPFLSSANRIHSNYKYFQLFFTLILIHRKL